MLNEVFDIERNIRVIEENILTAPNCVSEFSKAICNTVLHLAKKESKDYSKRDITSFPKFIDKKSIDIPSHFIAVNYFCDKWGWPINTIKNFLTKDKFPEYRHASVSIHSPHTAGSHKWFVEEKRLLKLIAALGENVVTRNRAMRNLEMMKQIDKLKRKEIKLKER